MMMKKTIVNVMDFKSIEKGTMKFTCYGNVKGNIDHALDRTLDGAYQKSISEHKKNGTMPKMLWMHNPYETPIGKWVSMVEDDKGLLLEGEFADTEKGREMYTLMKDGHVNSFSIGYRVIEEKWNREKGCNDLIELDIIEISAVNWACNELSTLQEIKSHLAEGKLPTKAELREILDSVGWLSKRQIEKITASYQPGENDDEKELQELADILAKSELFK